MPSCPVIPTKEKQVDVFTAALLPVLSIVVVYVILKAIKENTGGKIPSGLIPWIALVLGVGVLFAIGESDFASKQVFFGFTLDHLNGYSKAIVGVLVGGGAVGLDTGFKTVRNIGENDPTT